MDKKVQRDEFVKLPLNISRSQVKPTHASATWFFYKIFGQFAKLQKATVIFVMSLSLPVIMEQLGSQWTHLNEIYYFSIF